MGKDVGTAVFVGDQVYQSEFIAAVICLIKAGHLIKEFISACGLVVRCPRTGRAPLA